MLACVCVSLQPRCARCETSFAFSRASSSCPTNEGVQWHVSNYGDDVSARMRGALVSSTHEYFGGRILRIPYHRGARGRASFTFNYYNFYT